MTSLTADENRPAQVGPADLESSVTDVDHGLLRELQQRLLRVVTSSGSKKAAISGVAAAVAEATLPAMMVYRERGASGQWHEQQLLHGTHEGMPGKLEQQLCTWCDDACRYGSVQINSIDLPHGGIAVTAPILLKGSPPDAFATVYRQTTQPVDRLVGVHQLIAAHIALWQVLGQAKQAEFEAQTTASLMELLANLETAGDLREACYRLVNELKEYLGCKRVALALNRRGKDHCQLVALSGMARFDKRTEIIRVMEAALDEAVVRDCLTAWPPGDDAQRQGGLAHEKLRSTTAAGCVISCPLRDDSECLVGAWLFLGAAEFAQDESNLNFIEAAGRPIGSRMRLLQNSQRGRVGRLVQSALGPSRTTRRKLVLAFVCLLAAILAVPLPYKVRCQCTVEPVVRRVVVAPYDGILKETHVEPGDIVSQNQALAEMDEREIRWELAGLDAEYNRARKERDATLADDEVAAAQRAKLEMTQLDLKRQLLQHRGANLEIKSPIDGMVISGDLEKVEGAPLTVGDSLFEIAPLEKLLVELAIADREFNHVQTGDTVEIRLEAYPWQKWQGKVANVWPRSEIREQENVFIAEVRLDNSDLQLRPGMKGAQRSSGDDICWPGTCFTSPANRCCFGSGGKLQPDKDYQIRDLGRIVLTLREDLAFSPQTIDGKPGYVIEDPVRTKFYRVGIAEYKFISLFDGSTSVADALRTTAATLSDQAFTQDEAATICKWLVDVGLAHTSESAQAGRLAAAASDSDRSVLLQRLNPIFIRVPLVQPDRFLDAVAPLLGWVHGPLGLTLSAVLAVIAGCQLMVDWDRFAGAADGVFAPSRWLWLGLTWLMLKVVHEVSHGLVCKRYGGTVREGGLMFILFAPLAYVDVTSSWRFPSKWQRIHTAAAGIYVELLVAAAAVLVWSRTGPGILNDTAFNLVIMASFTTIVFNANPLMRFDGYYILSDLLEIPNLYHSGQQYVSYLGRRYLLGTQTKCPRWSDGKDSIIKLYGVAAMMWRGMVSVSLVISATAMFAGAGLVLAIVAATIWLGSPMLRFAKFFLSDPSLTRSNRVRFVAKTAATLTLGVLFFTYVPWPGIIQAPAIVDYSDMAVVRAGSPGFVQTLVVQSGQFVEPGDVLVILENDELRSELADLELEIEDSQLVCRAHERDGRRAAYQAELKRRESLEKQHKQKADEVQQLTVCAPIAGQIIGRNLDALQETYVAQGAEILSIGDQRAKEIQISVAQNDLDTFAHHLGKPIAIRVSGSGRFSSALDKVSPRASMEPLHAALCSPNGGPLAVRQPPDDSDKTDSENESYELLAPRFLAVVAVDERRGSRLQAGQRGVASFRDHSDTIGRHIYNAASQWIRKKFAQASNATS